MTITNSSTRFVALAAGVALVFSLAFGVVVMQAQAAALTPSQVSAIISLLQSFGADQATINNVQASLNGQATPGTGTGTGNGAGCPALTRDLQVGSTGTDVMALQKFLNGSVTTQIAVSGAGAPGSESTYFGGLTKAAVMKFQAANSVSPIAGYVGKITRAAITAVCSNSPSGNPNPTPTPTPTAGTGLAVSASSQPANGIAPALSNRIPFTNFTVTAGNDGDVTLNSVTVQRMGASSDSSFSGIELLDASSGLQIGISRTLNSNHQATIGDTIVIPRGTSRTFTVAANRAASGLHAGEIASFAVVAVNTSATVSGSLPISGASHTINESLTIGSVSTSTSSFIAPTGVSVSKNIGDTNVKFSGVKFTANSAEDLKLVSIRWRQTGSVSSGDLANLMTVVAGTSYPVVADATGKYFTVVFPSGGVLITKGNSIDVYIQGDIVGSGAAGRTAEFDIDKVSDVYFVGQTFGYGVSGTGTVTPWYHGDSFAIGSGSATTISKATEVASQNIAVNVSNQPLGGFVTDFRGEAVQVTSLPITFATSSITSALTSITLVNENGSVVAGPIDEASNATSGSGVTFTDTITFPTGRHVWTIKGKVPSAGNGGTIVASTIPANWTGVTGQTSGNTITLSGFGTVTMNTMTVKAAVLTITMSNQPAPQNIVAGGQGIEFGRVQIDASQSGEDIRLSSISLRATNGTGLTTCQLFNGAVALNTGSNVLTSISTTAANVFTLDNSLIVPKGTVLTLSIKCNTTASLTGTYTWSTNVADTFSGTGVTSGSTATVTNAGSTGPTMTQSSSSLVLSVDSSSPSYTLVAGGTTGQTMSVLKFRAANEAVNLTKIGLVLTASGNTLSTAAGGSTHGGVDDLIQVYIYDGANLVGTATFTGATASATSTLNTVVTLPKDTDKTLIVKADLAGVGQGQGGGIGDIVKVDPQNAEGTGVNSGSTIGSGLATPGAAGVRLFHTFPVLALDTLSSTGAADGRLMRFKVTANSAGPVGLFHFEIKVASTTGVGVNSVQLFGFTDSGYSNPISSGASASGQVGPTIDPIANNTAFVIEPTTGPVQVPAGSTYYFEIRASVTGVQSGSSVVTTLLSDSAYPTVGTGLTLGYNVSTSSAATSTAIGNYNFVWSDNASTTATYGTIDWTNGFGVSGLPSSGLIQTRSN